MKFSELFQRYGSMEIPSLALRVGGVALEAGEDACLLRAECSLTCRPEAGYLLLEARLDPEGPGGKTWLGALQLGAACSFSLGYGNTTKEVFTGELYDIRWEDPLHGEMMAVEALFLDVRGRLTRSFRAASARTLSELVNAAAEEAKSAGVSCDIRGVPEEWDLPASWRRGSDYELLRGAAEFLFYEFYVWADTLYFGPPRPESKPAVEFDGPDGLTRLRRFGTLSGQCKTVTVLGADDAGERLSFSKTRRDSLAQVVTSERQISRPDARTMAQVQYLAESSLAELQRRSGGLAGWSAGVPELRPGRFIKASGLSGQVNGTYYVRTVRHTLDETGFETYFESEV